MWRVYTIDHIYYLVYSVASHSTIDMMRVLPNRHQYAQYGITHLPVESEANKILKENDEHYDSVVILNFNN